MNDDSRGLMTWGEFFRAGGAMGFTPKDIRGMSLWEFMFTVDGFKKSHGSGEDDGKPRPPTEEEFEARLAQLYG